MSAPDNFQAAFFAARDALEAAAEEQKSIRADTSLPLADRMDAGTLSDDLLEQKAHLESSHNAFIQKFFTVSEPPEDVINDATRLANELAGLVASSLRAQGLIDRVIGILSAFDQLLAKPVAGAQAAPAVDTAGAEVAAVRAGGLERLARAAGMTNSAALAKARAHFARQ